MKKFFLFLFVILLSGISYAQVGVNATTIDPSAALDIQFGTSPKGLLTPRMTTLQRTGITTPADGLIVYDTDLKSFFHYKTNPNSWIRMSSDVSGRLSFKRIKSTDVLGTVLKDELTAGGGIKYKLNTNTLYEINGTVTFNFPIDLNNAYVQGLDSGEDKIETAGNIFDGSTGGTVKGLTLVSTGGKVFNLSGAATENLIIRDGIIANSFNVGTINNFGLVFLSTIQFSANTTGITYSNISQLLLDKMGWFGNNLGTFEKLSGTFKLVQKQGGFSEVNGSAIGFDVSANPTITGDAVLETVVFTGTNTTGYVKPYTGANTYSGYNFNNSWNVRSAGIPTETDASAVGEFSFNYEVGAGAPTPFNTASPSNIVKVNGVSGSTTMFRFSTGGVSNKLVYLGKKKRFFQVTGSISFQVPKVNTYIIYIAKNNTVISQYKVYGRATAVNDIIVLPLNALVELANTDYIEVFAQRFSSTNTTDDTIITPNMTLVIK